MYRDRPRTLNELKSTITAYIRTISQADLRKVFANKIKRVQAYTDARGHHFQQLLVHPTFRMHCIIIYGLSGCTILLNYLVNRTTFFKKNIKHKMCVLSFSANFVWNVFFPPKKIQILPSMNIGLQVKYQLFLSDFRKILKFQEKPSSGNPDVISGWTDMIKVIVVSPNFANIAKNECLGLQVRTRGGTYWAGFIKKTNHNWTTCLCGPYSPLNTHQLIHAFSLFLHQMTEKYPVSKMVCCVGNMWKQTKFTNVA